MTTAMDIDSPPPTTTTKAKPASSKNLTLTTATLKSPPFSYAHLTTDPSPATLDTLQVRSYCTSALRQFLGDTGVAISIDILLVRGSDIWVRVPRPDLGAFAAALTAYPGMSQSGGGETVVLRLRACGDWLGALLGRSEEGDAWGE